MFSISDFSDKIDCYGLCSTGLNTIWASLLPELWIEDLFKSAKAGGMARSTLYNEGLIALTGFTSDFFSFLFVWGADEVNLL